MPAEAATPLLLVVDDQNDNLRFLGEILDRAGYGVMPALNGPAALSRASLRKPDLALLDITMPGMDGIETCRRLRRLPGLEELPVLFVTAAGDRQSLTRAFEAGAVDYITKPFVVDELLARVRNHLELKEARERLLLMLHEREEITDIIAHDLKNPLTCILFAARSLLDDPSHTRCHELSQEVRDCAEEALRQVQRFLTRGANAERLRSFSQAPVDVAAAARDALRLQRTAAEHSQLRLEIEGQGKVLGDAQAVRNVIQGLVSNAIRHSGPDSSILVRIAPGSSVGWTCCEIFDSGRGVAEAIRERLFERYVRDPDAQPEAYSSGLGLAIARGDIEQMGGRLWYEPRPGGGSLFAFELRTATEESADAP